MATTVRTEISQQIATVTMARPDSLNALNDELAHDLNAAFESLDAQQELRVILLTGEGNSFMAGGDINFFASLNTPRADQRSADRRDDITKLALMFDGVHGIIKRIRQSPLPVLASVRGSAAGFGLSLMAACDLVIAAESTIFTLAYCHLGTSPDGGSTWTLPRSIGMKKTFELAMLGERFTAQDAMSMQLINRVVPDAQLDTASLLLAQQLAAGPKAALARTKQLLNASTESDLASQLEAEQAAFIKCTQSAEFAEGVKAFLEKRRPDFRSVADTSKGTNQGS